MDVYPGQDLLKKVQGDGGLGPEGQGEFRDARLVLWWFCVCLTLWPPWVPVCSRRGTNHNGVVQPNAGYSPSVS